MASYQVAQGDSLLTISNKTGVPYLDLLASNPGVQTVKPGQVINVNSKFAGAGLGTGGTNTTGNSFGNPPKSPSGNTFSYAPAGNNSYGSLNTPPRPAQANFQTPTTNGFNAPAGYTNLTPSQSQNVPPSAGNVNLTPSQSQNIPTAQTPATQSQPARPTGTYTGDPNDPNTAAWKAYWNYSAQNPSQAQNQGQGNAPRVMSRSEIWNMKANSRRKKMAKSAGDDQTGGGNRSPAMPVAQPDLVRNIVWGING